MIGRRAPKRKPEEVRQTKETSRGYQQREVLEARLAELDGEEERLRASSGQIHSQERGWALHNMRDVQINTLATYFEGELARNLMSYVDLMYQFTKAWSKSDGNTPEGKRWAKKASAMRDEKDKQSEQIRKKALTLFRTIRNTPEPQRLVLAHAIGPAFRWQLGADYDMSKFFGHVRYSDGDPNGNAEKGLKLLKLDHLVHWTLESRNYQATIPTETIEKVYASLARLPRASIEKKEAETRARWTELEAEREKVGNEISFIDYAKSANVSVDELKRRMPILMEDLELIRKSTGLGLQEVVIHPETQTIVTMSDRSVRGRGCGHEKVVSAYRGGLITDRVYTYRDPNVAELDRREYNFDCMEIVDADCSGITVRLTSGNHAEMAHFNLNSDEGRK